MTKTKDEILTELASKRTKRIVYTRVMGYLRPVESFNMKSTCSTMILQTNYLRPVESFNIGKKGEHQERVHFEESTCNRRVS